MTKSLLSFSDMFIGGNDFFIYSKVWNKIVSWDWFWFLSDCKSLTVLCFGLTDVKFSHFDIMINTKVRDEVVSWRRDRRFHSGLQLMTKLIFSFFKIGLCGNDFLISSKVWHEIISWNLSIFRFWVIVLSASAWGANWIRLNEFHLWVMVVVVMMDSLDIDKC